MSTCIRSPGVPCSSSCAPAVPAWVLGSLLLASLLVVDPARGAQLRPPFLSSSCTGRRGTGPPSTRRGSARTLVPRRSHACIKMLGFYKGILVYTRAFLYWVFTALRAHADTIRRRRVGSTRRSVLRAALRRPRVAHHRRALPRLHLRGETASRDALAPTFCADAFAFLVAR